ncbi:hypothetical protein [Sphingomonas sp.]|uniref:hypothetical protein n=1 Tax=Sphingomonas sp. TaxID=28214 RepID=UPI0035BBB02C
MTLSVEIGHLIVDAPGPVDPLAIRAGLEAELARRFAGGAQGVQGGAVDRMSLHLAAGEGPGAGLGARLGEAVHTAVHGAGGGR